MSLGQLQEAIRVLHGASVLALPPLAKAKVYYLLGAAFAARGPAHLKQVRALSYSSSICGVPCSFMCVLVSAQFELLPPPPTPPAYWHVPRA